MRECHIVNAIVSTHGCPMNRVRAVLIVIGNMKLTKNFSIPMVLETHELIKAELLAHVNCLLKCFVIILLIIWSVHIFHSSNESLVLLVSHNRGVEIHVKLIPKPRIDSFHFLPSKRVMLSFLLESYRYFE